MRTPAWLVLLLFWAAAAQAHDRSESASHWSYAHGQLQGVITIRNREITRLVLPGDRSSDLGPIFAGHVQQSVNASVDSVPCRWQGGPQLLSAEPGFVRVAVAFRCAPGKTLELNIGLLFAVAPSHHHFIYLQSGQASREAILTHAATVATLQLDATGATRTGLLQFVSLGVEHILTGIDHLAFLLALLIGARTWRQVIAIVSGFTVGHSVTLTLAVLGIITPNRTAVECLIGLTIALAAGGNLLRAGDGARAAAIAMLLTLSLLLVPASLRPDLGVGLIAPLAIVAGSAIWLTASQPATTPVRSRLPMAAGFGLIHGLGFAGALQDLHLPRPQLLPTLLGFNLGVELGQLAVVAAGVALVRLAQQVFPPLRTTEQPAAVASAILLAAGLSWYLTRALVAS